MARKSGLLAGAVPSSSAICGTRSPQRRTRESGLELHGPYRKDGLRPALIVFGCDVLETNKIKLDVGFWHLPCSARC